MVDVQRKMTSSKPPIRPPYRWRDFRTAAGGRPVKSFIDSLTDEEVAEIVAAMKEVAWRGLQAARHVRNDIYEVRVAAASRDFRILFTQETKFVLLSLSGFVKGTQKTPIGEIDIAEKRLAQWRQRGKARKTRTRP